VSEATVVQQHTELNVNSTPALQVETFKNDALLNRLNAVLKSQILRTKNCCLSAATRETMTAESFDRDPAVMGQGQRAIELASGVAHRYLSLEVLPAKDDVSRFGLIYCADRGKFDDEDPKVGIYSLTKRALADTGHIGITCQCSSSNPSVLPSLPLFPQGDLEDKGSSRAPAHGGSYMSGVERDPEAAALLVLLDRWKAGLSRPGVREALAANLDLWASAKCRDRYNTDRPPLGPQGWALAVLTGCQDVELTQRQLGMLMCLGDKQTSRLVAKLKDKKVGFAKTYNRGRKVIVQLKFGTNLVDFPELAQEFHLAEAERERAKKEQHLLHRNGPSLAEKMADRQIWGHSEKELEKLSPEVRAFIESARTSMRVRREVIRVYERQLDNLGRILRERREKVPSAPEKPVTPPEPVRSPEEEAAALERVMDRIRRSGEAAQAA
jgi:hypothetical protein